MATLLEASTVCHVTRSIQQKGETEGLYSLIKHIYVNHNNRVPKRTDPPITHTE